MLTLYNHSQTVRSSPFSSRRRALERLSRNGLLTGCTHHPVLKSVLDLTFACSQASTRTATRRLTETAHSQRWPNHSHLKPLSLTFTFSLFSLFLTFTFSSFASRARVIQAVPRIQSQRSAPRRRRRGWGHRLSSRRRKRTRKKRTKRKRRKRRPNSLFPIYSRFWAEIQEKFKLFEWGSLNDTARAVWRNSPLPPVCLHPARVCVCVCVCAQYAVFANTRTHTNAPQSSVHTKRASCGYFAGKVVFSLPHYKALLLLWMIGRRGIKTSWCWSLDIGIACDVKASPAVDPRSVQDESLSWPALQ